MALPWPPGAGTPPQRGHARHGGGPGHGHRAPGRLRHGMHRGLRVLRREGVDGGMVGTWLGPGWEFWVVFSMSYSPGVHRVLEDLFEKNMEKWV